MNWEKDVIPTVKEQLDRFEQDGIKPTLRTMFYTLVSLGVLENRKGVYNRLSHITAEHRRNRILPPDCFADNVRGIINNFNNDYFTPEEYVRNWIHKLENLHSIYSNFIPRWYKQPHRVEIWTEKNAMVGTLQSILQGRDVVIAYIRGYDSQTNEEKNFRRITNMVKNGIKVHIRYFGDFDPSGNDIERNILRQGNDFGYDRLGWGYRGFEIGTDFKRVAVDLGHVRKYKLPHSVDVKKKLEDDPRAKKFKDKHGELFQVEVDALPAYDREAFRNMVLNSVDEFFDQNIYEQVLSEFSESDIKRIVKDKTRQFFDRLG